jgi:hypothetical protein
MRRGVAWLVAAPVALAGSQLAHHFGYVAVAPEKVERSHLLATTGHGYQQHLPLVAALAASLCVTALVAVFLDERRGRAGARLGAAIFALVPLTVFPVQEHLERWLHDGAFPLTAALAPTFLIGLALQVPFALLAYLVAHGLLSATSALARRLGRGAVVLPRAAARARAPRTVSLPRPAALARGYAERGPPLAA